MIIKRRVTRGFVQIANEVVRDQRLSLAAHGLLHYLLSLPDNWEVNLKQIESYWSIGRDKRRSLFNELRRFGWAQLERITSEEDGTFLGQRWIIGDDPGPEITDSEAVDEVDDTGDAAEGAPTMNATAAPESKGPDALASESRETPFPAVGTSDGRETRPPENTSLPRRKTPEEDLQTTNTTGARAISNEGDGEPPPTLGSLLRLWPAENIASAFACERAFGKLTAWQQVQAHRYAKAYLEDARGKGQTRLCDLRTYLDERRFERFANKGALRTMYACKRGTPQAERWREHYVRFQPERLKMFDYGMRNSGVTTTESEWPPPIDPLSKAG